MAFNTIFTKNNRITVQDASDLVQSGEVVNMVLPLWIGLKENAEWMFPIEPLISISGKNIIVKRNVAKANNLRGSIKERWSEDDFTVNIQGSFREEDLKKYPESDIQDLMYYLNQRQSLYVKNELLQLLDIHQIAIESYSFPFSKGENVQNFSIDAVSDDKYKLFIDVKDV